MPINFFKKCVPSKETIVRSSNVLAAAIAFETAGEVFLAGAGIGLETFPILLIPILVGMLNGIQSGIFRGKELNKNAERAANALQNTTDDLLEREEGQQDRYAIIKNCYATIAIPILWTSGVVVPAAQFFLAYYQMQELLSSKELFGLADRDPLVVAASTCSGYIASYYSLGTEGAAALEWTHQHANCNCGCCPGCLLQSISLIGNAGKKALSCIIGTDKLMKFKSGLGALNHSVLECGAIFVMLRLLAMPVISAGVLAGLIFLVMASQNFTFQGREFSKNARKLFNYLNNIKNVNPEDYESLSQDPKLEKWQKILLVILKLLFIIVPGFTAHFALTGFTMMQGLKDFFKTQELTIAQTVLGVIAGAFVDATGETLTEAISACDEIDEKIAEHLEHRGTEDPVTIQATI